MSPVPVPLLMCALMLCSPPQSGESGDEPAPGPVPAASAPRTASSETPGTYAAPSTNPSASPSPGPPPEAIHRPAVAPTVVTPPPVHVRPMSRHTVASPDPAGTVSRVIGHVSCGILVLLCAVLPALRLTVGWPRFPAPYVGRRRQGRDRPG